MAIQASRTSRLARTLPAAIAIVIAVAACQSAAPTQLPASTGAGPAVSDGPRGTDTLGTPVPDGPGVAAARAAIHAADVHDDASIAAISAILVTDEGAAAAAQAIQAGVTGDALWAATWVYATSGTDPSVLLPAMTAADDTTKALAAASLLGWGSADAADVLAGLVADESTMRGSEPPISVGAFAAATLERFIAGPDVAPDAPLADVAAAWTSWLAGNGEALRFDPEAGTWSVP